MQKYIFVATYSTTIDKNISNHPGWCAAIDKNISENTQFFRGECNGYITKKRAGTSGFGYDPIFYYPEKQCTLSELGSNEKNKISHRYKALKKFAESI